MGNGIEVEYSSLNVCSLSFLDGSGWSELTQIISPQEQAQDNFGDFRSLSLASRLRYGWILGLAGQTLLQDRNQVDHFPGFAFFRLDLDDVRAFRALLLNQFQQALCLLVLEPRR